ncbi:MAG: hypothetical protein EZS28_042676 [Streblomastix strix]|uniref:Uncharacterized protein n=1 Tax=Streblomastix strix TaxID=222440 RepID=A0A5J4TU71_9EUKA|nr:MAG: hypothetical protein EZS28_042676 [Streblomastix strix]
MKSEQKNQKAARAIVSFTDSYVQNKQRKQNKQQKSKSTLSLAQVTSSLEYLLDQIHDQKFRKQVIRIPKLLQSLIALVTFRLGTHLREQTDLLRLKVRRQSRLCLYWIQYNGEEQDQTVLVRQGYGRVMSITFSTAGGVGEEEDYEIYSGLIYIYYFFRKLHERRSYDWQRSIHPLPLLLRRSEEQIEEEGAIEEIEAQMNNKGYYGNIKQYANEAKTTILNRFIHRRRI